VDAPGSTALAGQGSPPARPFWDGCCTVTRWLGLLTGSYLAVVAWVTLTPQSYASPHIAIIYRILNALHRRGYLLSVDSGELASLANIALFVPVGMFLLLLVGTRLWWVTLTASFFLTAFIEAAQRHIPGRARTSRTCWPTQSVPSSAASWRCYRRCPPLCVDDDGRRPPVASRCPHPQAERSRCADPTRVCAAVLARRGSGLGVAVADAIGASS
jgi:hypothetical protein